MSLLSLNSSHGLPLCLSGITHPLTLSTEMVDHDKRREEMKKQRNEIRRVMSEDQEMGNNVNSQEVITEEEISKIDEDLARVLYDLSFLSFYCTAKAA